MTTIISEMLTLNKSSADANDEKLKQFEEVSHAEASRILQSKNLADVTALMDGSVMLSYLSDKQGARDYVLAELAHRQIKYYNDEPVEQMSKAELKRHESGDLQKQSITLMKKALKNHEHVRLCAELKEQNPRSTVGEDERLATETVGDLQAEEWASRECT